MPSHPESAVERSGAAQVAIQFDNAGQQRVAANMGMWVFLSTEVMFFGGLFLSYLVYRHMHLNSFIAGSNDLNFWIGTINTMVLLCSSFTMALAVRSAQVGKNRALVLLLSLTLVLGLVFLGLKFFEYWQHYEAHHIPGPGFVFDFPHLHHLASERGVELFMFLYFVMTGLHALHMLVGVSLITWLIIQARKRAFTPAWHNPVENIGLYWHFVDIVWIYLYPMLYLIDLSKK